MFFSFVFVCCEVQALLLARDPIALAQTLGYGPHPALLGIVSAWDGVLGAERGRQLQSKSKERCEIQCFQEIPRDLLSLLSLILEHFGSSTINPLSFCSHAACFCTCVSVKFSHFDHEFLQLSRGIGDGHGSCKARFHPKGPALYLHQMECCADSDHVRKQLVLIRACL